MKNTLRILLITVLACFASCDLLDPTEVVNPNLTEDAILSTDDPMISWIAGCERQVALIYNAFVTISEIGSDNYVNTRTFFNQNLDKLNVLWTDPDINNLQFQIHRLREMADYGLTTVADADAETTDNQLAELNFFKGLSFLLAGEYFKALPGEPEGVLQTPSENLNTAITYFTTAISLATEVTTEASATLARSRANYRLGNAANAKSDAEAAITLDGDFLRQVNYDAVNGPTSTIQDALFDRGTFDDLQPLPRLDFLDPKHFFISNSEESPVTLLKIEEAYLIIAEAQIAQPDLAGAKTTLNNLLTLIASRPIESINDNVEGRTESSPGSRPNKNDIQVAASSTDPLRLGLVLTRNGTGVEVDIPVISGTSVNSTMINAVATEDEALELLYLMRQEIFFAEGRRMVDMGVKLVVSEVEALSNSNVADSGDPATIVSLPTFINAIKTELDAFTYDAVAKTCVITHNVNKILVQNKASAEVLPFN